MKKWVLVTLAAILLAPAAFGANTAVNQAMANADVSPGELVVAQRIQITASADSGLWYVVVRNTDGTGAQLTGAGVEKVEVVRESDDRVIGTQSNPTELANLTSAITGVSVQIPTYRAFATTTLAVQVRVKLKSSVALGAKLKLGWATVDVRTPSGSATASIVTVTGAAAPLLTVGPSPIVEFDGAVPDAEAYRGERFLAGRIAVDAGAVPFDFTVTQVVLTNISTGTKLSGTSIARIEVRRASDGVLLGEQTTDIELNKLTTTGCKVTCSSSNTTSAYGMTLLELWVTLKSSVPAARTLKLQGVVRCGGADFTAGNDDPDGDEAPVFTTVQAAGFKEVTNLTLDGGQVYSGQRFLAQSIEVKDTDVDPFDVSVTSLVIQNAAVPAERLAENHVVRVEVVRARDGAPMGSVSSSTGLNGGGVRVTTSSSNVVTDDSAETLEIWVTLGASIPDERKVQLQTTVWHTEDAMVFGPATDPGAEFTTGPAVGAGFEAASSSAELVSRTVLSGGRFLAQRLVLTDSDADPYNVTVTSVMVRNVVGDNWLADQNVARLEVRRKSDGALLGEVVDPVGLSLAGVRVTTSANNTVPDDSTVTLEIWVTLKVTAPAGRKIQVESIVWHTEGVAVFQKPPLAGPATFTTKVGTPPSNVNFTWTPAAPKYNQEVTFTPAATIVDPEGAIAKATYSWEFGDGKTATTTGTAVVKHTYTTGGTFSVVLTVTGEAGLSSSKTNAVAVEGPPNVVPTATFTWTPVAPASITTEVTFTSTVTDSDQPAGTAFTYAWNFGDTATSALANPKHTFAEKKSYTVKLTVTDARSAAVTVEHTISVGNTLPVVATLTASNVSPNTGDVVTLTATATDADSDAIATYTWTFGDGTAVQTTTTGTTTHTYAAPGMRTVSVTATDSRGAVSVAKTLSITVAGPDRILLIIYPNPAKTQATVRCSLPSGVTEPVLVIYSLGGDIVLRQELTAGQVYIWNLLDAAGDRVGNGLYFGVVTATAAGGGSVRSEVFRLLIVR